MELFASPLSRSLLLVVALRVFFLCCFLAPLGRLQSDVISFSRAHIRDSLPLRGEKASPRVFPLRGTHTRKCYTPIDGQRNLRSGKGWAGSWPNWQLKFSQFRMTRRGVKLPLDSFETKMTAINESQSVITASRSSRQSKSLHHRSE